MADLTLNVSVSRQPDACDTVMVFNVESYDLVDYQEAYYCPNCDRVVSVLAPDNTCSAYDCGYPNPLMDLEDYHLAAPTTLAELDTFKKAHIAEYRAMIAAAILDGTVPSVINVPIQMVESAELAGGDAEYVRQIQESTRR